MDRVTRRSVLGGAAAATVGAFAGCMGVGSGSSAEPDIGYLEVSNHVTKPVTVQVLLTENDDLVYWASADVPAAKQSQSGAGNDGGVGEATFKNLPTEPANYVLHVRTAKQPKDTWETVDFADFDFSKYDTACLSFDIRIGGGSDKGGRTDVEVFSTRNPSGCKGGSSGSS